MSAQPSVVALPSSADAYIRHGWKICHIPEGTKGPQQAGWNKIENALTEAPQHGGVGLMHSYSGTCALDIDDFEGAKAWLQERGINMIGLFGAADAVAIDSGNAGHAKLLFALPVPLPTKKIVVNGKTILEFRCGSANGLTMQDLIPPSRHPSGTVYRWVGRGNWQQLPTIPDDLFRVWGELLARDADRSIKTEGNAAPTSIDEMRSALFAIPPDCGRKPWVECGMALASVQTEDPDQLFGLWDEWSQGAPAKYPGHAEMVKQWRSFKPLPTGIGIGTLFFHAALCQWRRPAPDVSQLFAPIDSDGRAVEDISADLSLKARMPINDPSLWPPILVARANELAVEVGADPIVSLMAGLMAVSGAAHKQSALVINPSWKVPPTLWAMTIGNPSDKKTPASKPLFAPLRKLESEDRKRYEQEMLNWIGKEARHAADMKAFRDWQQSPEAHMPNAVPPTVMGLPPKPEPLRLVLTDATTQKVVGMSEHRPRGFLLYMDEMARWLSKLSDPRHSDDRGCWIQGYETGPYSMDRMGAGSIRVENMALSIYGNCQPTVFRQNVQGASSDGILQRFMPVVLNPIHNKMWQEAVPAFMSSENAYEQLIRRTYATPAVDYTLSAGAMTVFRSFCEWALKFCRNSRILDESIPYQTALGKMEGNCARMMLLFHLIESPYELEVAEDVAFRVTQLFKTFFVPSLRYTFLEVGRQQDPTAEIVFNTVLQWASSRPTVTLSELRVEVKDKSDRKDYPPAQLDLMIRATMDEMATMNYVALFQDHPRYPSWTINPAMAELFADKRRQIILARQEAIDSLNRKVREQKGESARGCANAIGFTEEMRGGNQ
jgi:hypothetical protein